MGPDREWLTGGILILHFGHCRNDESMAQTTLEIAKALGDETRLRLLLACRGQEVCVCQLQALVGLAMSTVSQHLTQLRRSGLLVGRKQGRWMYYRMPDPDEPGLDAVVRAGLGLALAGVQDAEQYKKDRAWLDEIVSIDPEALCRLLKVEGCCTPESLRQIDAADAERCC